MANSLYDWGREGILKGEIAWIAADIRVILIDEGVDVPDLANDVFLSDRAAGARVATSSAFTGKTATAGVADASDVVLSSVSGAQSESLDIYEHTGVEGSSQLVGNIDSATGLPITPNGGDITIQWDSGANRIFKL